MAIVFVAAAANGVAATCDFTRARFVLDNMARLGVQESWLIPLGALKAAGALGLLVGLAVPPIGMAASLGLVVYFLGAIVAVLRARWYAHLPGPAMYLLLAAGSLMWHVTSA